MQIKHWLWNEEKKESANENETFIQDFTGMAYAKAWQVVKEKREELSEGAETEKFFHRMLPYDVPRYIGKICWILRDLIAEMADVGKEFITVSFLYRLETGEDAKWQKITETGMCTAELVYETIFGKGTIYEKLQNGESPYVYILDKKRGFRCGTYRPNQRDTMFDCEGSILAMKMDFESGGKKYVQGILEISVYGKDFIVVDNCCRKQGRCFEYVMVYDILPYFRQMFQTEIGLFYMEEMRKRRMERS